MCLDTNKTHCSTMQQNTEFCMDTWSTRCWPNFHFSDHGFTISKPCPLKHHASVHRGWVYSAAHHPHNLYVSQYHGCAHSLHPTLSSLVEVTSQLRRLYHKDPRDSLTGLTSGSTRRLDPSSWHTIQICPPAYPAHKKHMLLQWSDWLEKHCLC